MSEQAHEAVLRVEELSIVYRTKRGDVKATSQASFDLHPG